MFGALPDVDRTVTPLSISTNQPSANDHLVADEPNRDYQLALDGFSVGPSAGERLARELRALDLANLTPREAIDWLFEQQDRLR